MGRVQPAVVGGLAPAEGSPAVVLPARISRVDGNPIELSPQTIQFATAMAFSDSWSAITRVRARRKPYFL